MEMTKTYVFCEMSDKELLDTNGGVGPFAIFLGICSGVGSIWALYDVGYAIGKFIAHISS